MTFGFLPLRPLAVLCALFLFAACTQDPPTQGNARYDRLYAQISEIQSNPAKVAFLTEESLRAGVSGYRLVASQRYYGKAHSNGRIELSTSLRGGTGVINITHEIAHVAGMRRNCNGHTRCWIKIYLEIAERFEARFPGERWSGTTPTLRVMRNVKRFRISM